MAQTRRLSQQWDPLIVASARANNINPNLVRGIFFQESGFNPNATGTPTHIGTAKGIAQLTPDTQAEIGVKDPYDPNEAIPAAVRFIAKNRQIAVDRGYENPDAYAAMVYYGGANMKPTNRPPPGVPGPSVGDYAMEVIGHANAFAGMPAPVTPVTREPLPPNTATTPAVAAPGAITSATQPVYNQATGKFEQRRRPAAPPADQQQPVQVASAGVPDLPPIPAGGAPRPVYRDGQLVIEPRYQPLSPADQRALDDALQARGAGQSGPGPLPSNWADVPGAPASMRVAPPSAFTASSPEEQAAWNRVSTPQGYAAAARAVAAPSASPPLSRGQDSGAGPQTAPVTPVTREALPPPTLDVGPPPRKPLETFGPPQPITGPSGYDPARLGAGAPLTPLDIAMLQVPEPSLGMPGPTIGRPTPTAISPGPAAPAAAPQTAAPQRVLSDQEIGNMQPGDVLGMVGRNDLTPADWAALNRQFAQMQGPAGGDRWLAGVP